MYKSILNREKGTLFKSCNWSVKNLVSTKYILKKKELKNLTSMCNHVISTCNWSRIYIYIIVNTTNFAVWECRLFSAVCAMIEVSEQEEGKWVNLHVVETEWEVKNSHKYFHKVLEKRGEGRGVETKRNICFSVNKSNYEWALSESSNLQNLNINWVHRAK